MLFITMIPFLLMRHLNSSGSIKRQIKTDSTDLTAGLEME